MLQLMQDIDNLQDVQWGVTKVLLATRGGIMRQWNCNAVNFALLSAGFFNRLGPPIASFVGNFLLDRPDEFNFSFSDGPYLYRAAARETVTALRLRVVLYEERTARAKRQLRESRAALQRQEDVYSLLFGFMERVLKTKVFHI